MEFTDIQNGLEGFVEKLTSDTLLSTYRYIERSSLTSKLVSTRANSLWKMSEYIVATIKTYSDNKNGLKISDNVKEDPTKTTDDYLKGWKSFAYSDQYLILEIEPNKWGMYNSDGNLLGGDDFIKEYFEEHKNDALKLRIPQTNVQQDDLSPIVYYGVPGTGKTSYIQDKIFSHYSDKDRFFLTFHQSFCYEEFIEGLKPTLDNDSDDIKYHIEEGIFSKACQRAAQLAGYDSLENCIEDNKDNRKMKMQQAITNGKTVVLCIDELNRGNVASIFGDLISLIEPSKRLGASGDFEMIATLPYSKRLFGVPANLFIVGTMNTADRSIQLLDSAIRRRFKFEELLPNYDVISNPNARAILRGINCRIRCLRNKDSQIGHSYLMHASNNKEILDALTDKIIPLLEEYFYNDIAQVRFVLNETKDDRYNFYQEDTEAKNAFENYLNSADIYAEERSFYRFDDTIKDVEEDSECAEYLQHLLPSE